MKSVLKALSCAFAFVLGFATFPFFSRTEANAYSLINGEKNYSIAADRYIYQTEKAFDETIRSFETWIRLPASLADTVPGGVIFGNYYNEPMGYPGSVNFSVGTQGKFLLQWNNGAFIHLFESTDLRTGEWTHVALTHSKEDNLLRYYVNGEEKESISAELGESTCEMNFGVGSDWNNWYDDKTPFMGEIRQITLYSKEISQNTVREDMQKSHITKNDRQNMGLMSNWYFGTKWASEKIIYDDAENNNCLRATYDKYVPAQFSDDFDYSFVVIPDMQAMTNNKPQNFLQQSEWIVDNIDKLRIRFAMYLGDMVELRYSSQPTETEAQWRIVQNAISKLDGIVPYSVILGNHDYDDWATATRNTTMFNKYFPYEKYSTLSNFGGAFREGDMANTYSYFRYGSIEYIVFALEYGPRYNVLNWVDRIISENPNSRIIITTHCYLDPDGTIINSQDRFNPEKTITYSDCNNPDKMWEKLIKKHSNIMMVFSGHVSADNIIMRKYIGDHGNIVSSFLIDAQGAMLTSAMNTLLVVQVNEKNKTMHLTYYSPEYDACYNEQNNFSFSFADENNPTVGSANQN